MKRIKIIISITIFSIILYLLYNINASQSTTQIENSTQQTSYTDSEPYIININKHSVSIEWQSEEKEIGSIEYGIIKDVYYKSKTDLEPTHTHKIVLNSLRECTKYYYHVSSESIIFTKESSNFTSLCDNDKMTHKFTKEEIDE